MKVPKPRKLPSGNWFIQMRLGGESVSITEPTEKGCIKAAQMVKAEYLAGKREKQPEKPPITLSEAVDNYIAARSNTLSPVTIRGYKVIQRNRFKGMMDKGISEIQDSEWITACNQEAALCSAKTLSNSWRFIAAVLRENKVHAPSVTLPQIAPNERPFLDHDQVLVFVKAVKGSSVEVAALLALSSLRRSEILALKWENVDLKKRRIFVKGAAVPDENNKLVQKKENKNKSSTRYVPIMMDELYEVLNSIEPKKGLLVAYHPNLIRERINRICKRNGLPEVGVHGLRHSFASLAYHLGVPEKITMEIGGWADNQTMRKIYTHVAKNDVSRYETELTNFFKNANESANDTAK